VLSSIITPRILRGFSYYTQKNCTLESQSWMKDRSKWCPHGESHGESVTNISAELGKFKTEDALRSGQLSGAVGSLGGRKPSEKSSQETADCTRA